jgi:hypothetical protein
VVAARQPDDPKRLSDIVISATKGGLDLANLPDLYVPYEQFRRDAGKSAKTVGPTSRSGTPTAAADPGVRRRVGPRRRLDGVSCRMRARNEDMAVIVDTKSGEIIGILPGESMVTSARLRRSRLALSRHAR